MFATITPAPKARSQTCERVSVDLASALSSLPLTSSSVCPLLSIYVFDLEQRTRVSREIQKSPRYPDRLPSGKPEFPSARKPPSSERMLRYPIFCRLSVAKADRYPPPQ